MSIIQQSVTGAMEARVPHSSQADLIQMKQLASAGGFLPRTPSAKERSFPKQGHKLIKRCEAAFRQVSPNEGQAGWRKSKSKFSMEVSGDGTQQTSDSVKNSIYKS